MKINLEAVYSPLDPPYEKCPYCGNEEYMTYHHCSGDLVCYSRFDHKTTDNTEMYEGLDYTYRRKFAYCAECKKKIFRIKE